MKNYKIAITGGIGSGKSISLNYLKEKGYPVYSCDEIYKEVIEFPQYIHAIKKAFPDCVDVKGIDRKKLSESVFNNTANLQVLNSIAHPLIMERLLERMNTHEGLVFAEVPLLFEGNFEGLFDKIIVLMRAQNELIVSITKRDGISEDKAKMRMNSQFDYTCKKNQERLNNDKIIILKNEYNIEALKKELDSILENKSLVKQRV